MPIAIREHVLFQCVRYDYLHCTLYNASVLFLYIKLQFCKRTFVVFLLKKKKN